VQWIATEHGIVDLFGLTDRQRADALISIADPAFRDELRRRQGARRRRHDRLDRGAARRHDRSIAARRAASSARRTVRRARERPRRRG
jgi:acyl-CoA hydrolase